MGRIESKCTVGLTRGLELPRLNGERRGDRYRLDDGCGLDPIEEPLMSAQDLLCLTNLLIVCPIGEPLCYRGTGHVESAQHA